MKLFKLSLTLFCAWCAVGCGSGDSREVTGQQTDKSAAGSSDQAKAAIQQGNQNARISQQIMKTRRLPNGEPLPGPGNPGNVQPPGFRG